MNKYTKAIVAALVAGLAVLKVATGHDSPGAEGITLSEWVDIIGAVLAAGGLVWGVPNAAPLSLVTPEQLSWSAQQTDEAVTTPPTADETPQEIVWTTGPASD